MFADDVIVVEHLEKVSEWKLAFKGKGQRMSRRKTEYIEYEI